MPLKLIPPGKRKGNKFYLVRGQLNGRGYEISTQTTDRALAQECKAKLELAILRDSPPLPGQAVTFARAAELYCAWRDPHKDDRRRIGRISEALGGIQVADIRHADLVAAANRLFQGKLAATKNREVMRPAAAVLHYAANQGLCAWLRVALFKEPRPKTRAVDQEVAKILINSLPELPTFERNRSAAYLVRARIKQQQKKLLLLWLFRQGPRISDALKIQVSQIDMKRRVVRVHIGKTDETIEQPLHDEVFEHLSKHRPAPGRLFPWGARRAVYAWLKPYCQSLGIEFTPHMARHSLGKWLNEDGASLRQIMDTLHHADPKSSIRYQSTDLEVIRAAGRRLGRLTPSKD